MEWVPFLETGINTRISIRFLFNVFTETANSFWTRMLQECIALPMNKNFLWSCTVALDPDRWRIFHHWLIAWWAALIIIVLQITISKELPMNLVHINIPLLRSHTSFSLMRNHWTEHTRFFRKVLHLSFTIRNQTYQSYYF